MRTTTSSPTPLCPSPLPNSRQSPHCWAQLTWALVVTLTLGQLSVDGANAAQLLAGAAKVDVTNTEGLVNDPLYVKALVLKSDTTVAVIVTVDVVALAEIGPIHSDYLSKVRSQLQRELNIPPACVLVNASHCHGSVCADVDQRTVQAVKEAWKNVVPVRVGVGVGQEDRIMENRRLLLKSGKQADVRHAYSLPPDAEVAAVGPVDPEIGILRLDRENGETLAVVYNFACHPIMGVPSGGNTADLTGFASRALEEAFDGSVALFLQGCAGDINPVGYKDVNHPRDAEPLGNLLGLSVLRAAQKVPMAETGELRVVHETLALPRADHTQRIASLQSEQSKLLASLQGTTLNLKTFLPLAVKYGVSGDYPSDDSHAYLHEKMMGREDLTRLDAENRKNLERYRANIYVMEELTRLQENLRLLKMHQAQNEAAGGKPLEVELLGLRMGDLRLITFPGELSVQIGLDLKKRSPHALTFVAGYSNGYLYYTPTVEQLGNPGAAQEDCDCLVAPAWQKLFEDKAAEVLGKL